MVQKEKRLQWHPAFFAGLQIELEKELDGLVFESEHQLGTKPKAVDVLVVTIIRETHIKNMYWKPHILTG